MPFPFESQRLTLLSKLAQSDYATAVSTTDPTVFRGVPVTDKNFTKFSPKISNNQDDAQGNDFATEEYLEAWDTERDMELPVTSEEIGYSLLAAFGSVTTSQPAVGPDPTVYQHVFTLQDGNASRQLPARTLVEILTTAYNALFPSMVVQSLSMKGSNTGRVMASVKMRGSGKKTVGSGVSVSQAVAQFPTARHYFFNSQADIVTKDNNNTTNSLDYGPGLLLNSWGFELDNDLIADDGYRPGAGSFQNSSDPTSGIIRAECLFGRRKVTINEFEVRANDQAKELADLLSRRAIDWSLTLTGPTISHAFKHQLVIQIPLVKYDVVELNAGGKITALKITPKPLFDVAQNFVIKATLTNTVTSYTS